MILRLKWQIAQYCELKWWKKYFHKKDWNEYNNWKLNYWNDILSKIEIFRPNNEYKVLDCGCGPSGIFMVLPNVLDIDAIDPLLLNYKNKLHFFKPEMYPYVNFITTSLENFETEKKYDFIFCMNAINHMNDIDLCYKKLSKMLKPNGYLILTIDAHKNWFSKKIFQLLPGDLLHPHQYQLNDYYRFLEINGLKNIKNQKLKSQLFFDHYLQIGQKE